MPIATIMSSSQWRKYKYWPHPLPHLAITRITTMSAVRIYGSQLRPPAPSLTESNLPDQAGKVFIVTGGNAGIDFELVKILYGANARVYGQPH
jgi:hypothetical protein